MQLHSETVLRRRGARSPVDYEQTPRAQASDKETNAGAESEALTTPMTQRMAIKQYFLARIQFELVGAYLFSSFYLPLVNGDGSVAWRKLRSM